MRQELVTLALDQARLGRSGQRRRPARQQMERAPLARGAQLGLGRDRQAVGPEAVVRRQWPLRQDHPGRRSQRRPARLEGARGPACRPVEGGAQGHRRHERGRPPGQHLGVLEGPLPAGRQAERGRARRSPPAARRHCQHARLLRATGHRRTGPAHHHAASTCAAHGRGKGGCARQPRAQPGAVRHLHGAAHRGRARVELRHQPAHPRRHAGPRAAGRRRFRLRPRGLGPLHQHQRAHAQRDRDQPALSHAVSQRRGASAPMASAWTRPMCTA